MAINSPLILLNSTGNSPGFMLFITWNDLMLWGRRVFVLSSFINNDYG